MQHTAHQADSSSNYRIGSPKLPKLRKINVQQQHAFLETTSQLFSITHRPHDERFSVEKLSTEEVVLMNTVDSMFCVLLKLTATLL